MISQSRFFELLAIEIGVPSVERQESVVTPLLHDRAVGNDGDLVGVRDGGKAVRHHQRGASPAELVQRSADLLLCHGVQRAGRLVQNQDGRILQENPGDRKTLLLSARKTDAPLADDGIVAVGKRLHILMDVRPAGGFDDLLMGRVEAAVANVVLDRGVEQIDILLDDTDVPAEGAQRKAVNLLAVKENLAALGIVKARNQVADGGFSAAARADESHRLTLPDG